MAAVSAAERSLSYLVFGNGGPCRIYGEQDIQTMELKVHRGHIFKRERSSIVVQ